MSTGIEWTDETWNPTTGCDRVSPGCDNCYALSMAKRLKAMGSADYQTDGDLATSGPGFGLAIHPHRLDQPLRDYRGAAAGDFQWPLPNVWLGVSVEDQKWANIRIPALLETPAAVRFLSCEPLLGPVSLFDNSRIDTGTLVDWVIVGGESGPKARPMHPAWARQLRDECNRYDIPFLFKQWGEWTPTYPAHLERFSGAHDETFGVWRTGKHAAGRELDGRTHDAFPVPATA